MKVPSFSHSELLSMVLYDPATGVFTNRTQRSSRAKLGNQCGWTNAVGYVAISVNNHFCLAHRLAFFYMTGQWPEKEVDHINGNRADNRFINLRSCSREINMQNMRCARIDSKSRLIGAYWHKKSGKWMSRISVSKKPCYLGLFATAEEAHAAYVSAKRQMHAGCTI